MDGLKKASLTSFKQFTGVWRYFWQELHRVVDVTSDKNVGSGTSTAALGVCGVRVSMHSPQQQS